jgi:hypothetical protein
MATMDENIIKNLNNEYLELSKQIITLNERRMEVLNKIKQVQSEYRKSLGEGEITVSVDIDDNSDDEDKIIVEPKAGVRGRKKKIEPVKVVDPVKEEEKVEEKVEEPKKTKVKKTTKKEEVVAEEEDEESEQVVKGKKGKKK